MAVDEGAYGYAEEADGEYVQMLLASMSRCYACHALLGALALLMAMVVPMCVDGEDQELVACAEIY